MRSLIFCMLFTGMSVMATESLAQCDNKVKISTTISNQAGEITVKLDNSENYECILYAYDGGKRIKVESKSGRTNSLDFNNLPVNRYYRVEIIFSKQEDILCKVWSSELINFKE